MEQDLISKKELLDKYSISYGALYRWKRKGLIPEEWFIKKSTITGQETFFPKKLICERVELIQTQKDDYSLDELAKQLNMKEEKRSLIILKTVFGDKTFYLDEIHAVYLDKGNRESEDITEKIFNL